MSRATIDAILNTALSNETNFQNAEFVSNGKYTQKLSIVFLDGSASTTEYVAPSGFGWELVILVTEGTDTYRKVIGEGIEAEYRNHDWQLMIEEDI